MAAVLAGAAHYDGLDEFNHLKQELQPGIFDQLAELFRNHASIPCDGWNARLFPFVSDYGFPTACFSAGLLEGALHQSRIARLRQDLTSAAPECIRAQIARGIIHSARFDAKADLVVSESVLEAVDDLDGTNQALRDWTRPGGYAVHLIDYGSHGVCRHWNGHWALSDLTWALLCGKRNYLLNRRTHSQQLEAMRRHGFDIVLDKRLQRVDGLVREDFWGEFCGMSVDDANTHLAFVVSRAR
jgi:hypothetical protein